jgi:PAS domain S-box-containing protein
MSLIARLCLLVLVAMLPALAIQLHHEFELRRDGERRLRAEALRLGEFAAGEMDRILDGARVLLVTLAEQPSVRGHDAAACSSHVARLNVSFPGFRDVSARDLDGRLFCSAKPSGGTPEGGGPEDHVRRRALATGGFAVGTFATVDGAGGLPVALPFDDLAGREAGVVTLGIGLDWLGDYFRAKAWPPGGSISIVDRNGRILVRWPDPQLVGGTMPESFRWMLAATRPGTTEGVGPDGVARIGGYVPPIAANGLLVNVALSKEAAMAELDRVLRTDMALIAAGLALALLAAVVGGHWFIRRPVGALLAVAKRWSRGEYDARAGLRDRRSEIGRLGQAFDRMAALLQEREAALRTGEERFHLLADTVPDMVWTAAPDGTITYANQRWFAYCGVDPEDNARGWPDLVLHPDDRERCVAAWGQALREGTPYEIEVRNRRHDGVYRWFLTRAAPMRDATGGRVVAWFGATTDIDDRKRAEEERELLVRELGHRIKNAFALVRALAAQSLRHSTTTEEFAPAFLGRLDALARLSALLGADERDAVDLRLAAETVLEPYRAAGNLRLSGPEVALATPLARALSLVLHELATNAAKYGALAREGGSVDLGWSLAEALPPAPAPRRLLLVWSERGGPPVRPPTRHGFGCTLIQQSVTHGLRGTVRLEFPPEGVRCRIELPLSPGAAG